MKTNITSKLILACLLVLSNILNAQFGGSITQSNAIWRDGRVVVGPNGLAPNTTPTYQLEVAGNSNSPNNDGIYLSQAGNGDVGIFLDNSANSGQNWDLISVGSFGSINPGFLIYDGSNSANRFYIEGSTGNIGIGTTGPAAQLNVVGTSATSTKAGLFTFGTNASTGGTGLMATSAAVGAVSNQVNVGLVASATCNGSNTYAYGIKGTGTGGSNSYGGYFQANGGTASENAGVYGYLGGNGASINAAVYGNCNGFTSAGEWGGYFVGHVNITGNLNIGGNTVGGGTAFFASDRKLKNDIKPLTNALDKIKLLKPSTYTFRTNEFKDIYLQPGEQMGLIAQELEEVFPNLVTEVAPQPRADIKGNIVSTTPGYKAVSYISLIPLLIASVQEQQKQIDEQKILISSLQKTGTVDGISQVDAAAAGFSMEQNIPNPFTHETLINYTLPQNVSNAEMIVYDMTGKQLSTLAIDPKGLSLTITSEKLAAGMYLYSIIADGKVMDTKRMIVAGK